VKAEMGGRKYGAEVLKPVFNVVDIKKFQELTNSTKHPSDFNDMHQIRGLSFVSKQLSKLKIKDLAKS
jgi:hypothetical protein